MDFLDEIADLKPVPAGGAAAAYTAALGMALVYKVVSLELHRKELDPAPQAMLRFTQKELERAYLDLKKLVSEDSSCYLDFARDSKSRDQQAGKLAFMNIMTCSMRVMEKAYIGLDWIMRMKKISAARLDPHLKVAAELLWASVAATAHLVRENIMAVQSPEKRESYLNQLEALYEEGVSKRNKVLETIRRGL